MSRLTNFSRINDKCLKNGFSLQTNLSEVKGNGLITLMDSLNRFSMEISNMRIIERIMYYHPFAFRTPESIKEIMKKNDPVISAFALMGNTDRNCNIKWLINTLNELKEYQPIQNIVAIGPPIIVLKSRFSDYINSGETIIFEVSTISKAEIRWWNQYRGEINEIGHYRKDEFSTVSSSYKTKETDKGYFFIEVTCGNRFQEKSEHVYVGDDKDSDEVQINNLRINPCCPEINEESTDIIPLQETDGIKRLALLIGCMKYKKCPLKAPENDINDLQSVLRGLGFTVYCFGNLKKAEMTDVLSNFANLYKNDINNAYIFFYFAGHGNQTNLLDYLELIDGKVSMSDVLKTLISNRPKLIVSIFDKCRNDANIEPNTKALDSEILQAQFPISENLTLIMSTLPTQISYEANTKFENSSLIVKPLCENLKKFAKSKPINLVLIDFIAKCDNIYQKSTIYATAMNDIIGIDILVPKILPKIQWIDSPKNSEIMKSISIYCRVFHNVINIFNSMSNLSNRSTYFIRIPTSKKHPNVPKYFDENGMIKLHMFRKIKNQEFLEIKFCIFADSIENSYTIRIFIPEEIISFLPKK